jgi:hypothetical protein
MKSLLTYIEEGMQIAEKDKGPSIGSSAVDPETQVMLNVAKAHYPLAHNDDFAALATLVRRSNKHSMADIKTLGAENDEEEADIDALEIENDVEDRELANDEHRLDGVDAELTALRRQLATLMSKQ